MAIGILSIFFLALLLIATEGVHRMNKAAVAMFAGTVCWLLYIMWGSDFVTAQHAAEYGAFLDGGRASSFNVKEFVAQGVFLRYTLEAANVVLFLLATASIVEVLNNNGCFDFIHEALYTKYPRRFLWGAAGLTFLLSANLDNLTTVCLMLAIMRTLVAQERLRWAFGAVIVVAANCGGACTVIGDTTSLALWTKELVTPTTYSFSLMASCLAAMLTVTALVHRRMPRTMELVRTRPPYRGDDTVLNRWQRGLMLLVGIGGLWFVPTFHRLTHLPAFLGALCVLGVLWIVDELCNRNLLRADVMVSKRAPMALQYQNKQNMLFFIGMTLAVGAVNESGLLPTFCRWTTEHVPSIYLTGLASGLASAFAGNVPMMLGNIAAFTHEEGIAEFAKDGTFWPLLSYCTAVGGSLLAAGTMGGFALWRMEGIKPGWYVRHMLPKVALAFAVGLFVFWLFN
ncbi:MAG: sodium:proton antiporter [Alloprevotella sp.]|nr:sodium:proton antiporter [Alloprevotella sp.]